MTEGFLDFVEFDQGKFRTQRFRVQHLDQDEDLGIVKWYAPWRRYCFFPAPQTLYDRECLEELRKFIEALMEERVPGEAGVRA